MAFTITNRARIASEQIGKTPQLILQIEGVDTIYGSGIIVELARYGDPGLTYGMPGLVYGGTTEIDDQSSLVMLEGSGTQIQQQLNPDKGAVSSVSSMQVTLVDKDEEITQLISPGFVVDDVLGRRCKLWLGFEGTAYPEDFIIIFRGIIDDVVAGAGKVSFNLAHPDQKKRQEIFNTFETELDEALDNSETTITLAETAGLLTPVLGPDGLNDPSLLFYVRIDDEIIRYTGISGFDLTGCSRGQLGTIAATHDDEAGVTSFYRLTGNAIDLALKLMLSGWNGPFAENLEVESFNVIAGESPVPNSIFFLGIDLNRDYGVVAGDYITTTGAANGANNVSAKVIDQVVSVDSGSYIVVNDVVFVDEADSAAVIDFRSQYDTLGEGLKMHSDEVDVLEHLRIQDIFLTNFDYDFYLKETINGKDFIEKQIYFPAGSYSLPRKSQASVGYHSGPIPGSDIKTLSDLNVKKPSRIQIRRTLGRNFYNTIIYRYEEHPLEDKFLAGNISIDATSKTRIPVGTKALQIDAKGIRTDLSGESITGNAATKRLNRYKYGAEMIQQIETLFKDGFNVEVGDIVLLDGSGLQISDTTQGSRAFQTRFFEVINKKPDFRTGNITFDILDTGFAVSNRYGLIAPSSKVDAGISTTQFIIKDSFSSRFGADEYRKWDRYPDVSVYVRSPDFSVISPDVTITNISGNTITVSGSLGFTPGADYIMEMSDYNFQTEQVKLIYGFMRDTDPFDDGKQLFRML